MSGVVQWIERAADTIWKVYTEIAAWMAGGTWYEVTLKIFGAIGALLILRGFLFACEEILDNEAITFIAAAVLVLATFAFLLLVVAMFWISLSN